eukprot:11253179-Karenia_brevis.AAC.1
MPFWACVQYAMCPPLEISAQWHNPGPVLLRQPPYVSYSTGVDFPGIQSGGLCHPDAPLLLVL